MLVNFPANSLGFFLGGEWFALQNPGSALGTILGLEKGGLVLRQIYLRFNLKSYRSSFSLCFSLSLFFFLPFPSLLNFVCILIILIIKENLAAMILILQWRTGNNNCLLLIISTIE